MISFKAQEREKGIRHESDSLGIVLPSNAKALVVISLENMPL